MEVTKIEIFNYKSIKDPITVHFQHNLPIVLIGKNGSGKTNILETLEAIASANSNLFNSEKNAQFRYKAFIKLSEQDFIKLFPDVSYDEEKCKLIACNGENGLQIESVQSDYIVPLLHQQIEDVRSIAEKLQEAIDDYEKQLIKISHYEQDEQSIRCFKVCNFNGETTNYNSLKYRTEYTLKQAKETTSKLLSLFSNEESALIFNTNIYCPYCTDNLSFKLQFVEPDLAPFEQKFISINKPAIKRELTKINKATKDSCQKINTYITKINERITYFKNTLEHPIYSENTKNGYSFLLEIQKLIGKKCLFLKNESNNVIFYKQEDRQYYHRKESFSIIETYLKKVYNGANRDELLKQHSNEKGISFSETERKEFENYLNQNLPEFENGMYDKVSLEMSIENQLNIFLHEKTGEKINLNMTSAGRRWYFTYYFMKNTLEKDDLFIIDEPAGMLHPLAQKEVLNELLDLEKQGVKVIYSTHSPYLIPEDWRSVHFVFMGENGTKLSTVETPKEGFAQMKEITGNDVFNLQEIVEKYNECDSEKLANKCYQVIQKHFESTEDASKILLLSKDAIISWRKASTSKKFRRPKLENVILIAEQTQTPITEFLS